MFIMSCGEDETPSPSDVKPNANFLISQMGNYAPSAVQFSDNSEYAVSYYWNFGDGDTSRDENPKHIYSKGGNYNVTLKISNATGESTLTKTVVINNAPTKLKITSLVLTAYPLTTTSGGGWDSGSGPDIYPDITYVGTGYSYYQSRKEDVINSQLPLTYNVNFTFTNLTYKNQIDFFDYDPIGSNEWMGGYYFTASNQIPTDGSKYPTSANFTSGTIKFTANFEWIP
jgi:uncharacterized membrane protein